MDIDLLAPKSHLRYDTPCGVGVEVRRYEADYRNALGPLIDRVERHRGGVFSSSFDFPGRYTRFDFGFADPPLELVARGETLTVRALNARGEILLAPLATYLKGAGREVGAIADGSFQARLGAVAERVYSEEERTRRPSLFTLLRDTVAAFRSDQDSNLGLYGAFGYDLVLQLDPFDLHQERSADQRDLVLFLPDELLVVDHLKEAATLIRYEFAAGGRRTHGLPRVTDEAPAVPGRDPKTAQSHAPGEFPAAVRAAQEGFKAGDMYECVLTQAYYRRCDAGPATLFRRLQKANPSPYGALINLGDGEFLVAASPEMFVRVNGRRVETCPISGTIARGGDAIGDAAQILALLNSNKDASELTMCTDVDRNDKARVCTPGSVKVIGRRQIEMYSRLIHTVDHVEGELREGFDALDAFLSHAWAVTVTGAPKRAAMRFIEAHEKSPRRWYGGAIGMIGFDGNMNTGLTLRTMQLRDGIAIVRAGATLLHDSIPEEEDRECALKASALRAVLEPPAVAAGTASNLRAVAESGRGKRVLFVDHEDSFVLILADYFRQTGAEVITLRSQPALDLLQRERPHLVVLSPGPGRPGDFPIGRTIDLALSQDVPVFGVCLGLQGIVEHFGGRVVRLGEPVHGKESTVGFGEDPLFTGLPGKVAVGRYHSLHAERASFPAVLEPMAETADGVIMAVRHRTLPVKAVQFHPESIMSARDEHGLRLVANVLDTLARPAN
jgi:anthranilate synthase